MGTQRTRLNRFILVPVFLAAALSVAHADPGKDLFDKQCASCHTIGGGDSGGPDLKGITAARPHEWLETIIMEPDKLTKAKDPVQLELIKKYGYEMPSLGISHDDALKIIGYLGGAAGAGTETGAAPAGEHTEVVVTPALVAKGKALFTGQASFAKGGAPCIACHRINSPGIAGGNMSIANLSDSYAKMGERGMGGALKSLKFPVMQNIYRDRPLTEDEISALIAFYKDAAGTKGVTAATLFPVGGVGIFIVFIAGMILYKRRTR
ncbi:c-type cytochrome [Geomobilimonas luticola]|uniref:Cytochrome c n=1 Tax=Geomobilimonas luticola TaxID=1114878 RepID=A0ABS5SFC0_9BACT|nr:cytochrome c [Geomobilimonas luticola]MBT0652722.1 cytochrome c [Geomobilimonas luticola]